MNSSCILRDILARKFISISWINKINLKECDFSYEKRYDLFGDLAWKLVNKILQKVTIGDARNGVPICHVTYGDGSEQDLYIHYGTDGKSTLLMELSHSYIDQHFIYFQLWKEDPNVKPEYPINLLFTTDFYQEKPANHPKVAEIFIRPVVLWLRASNIDLLGLLPTEETSAMLDREVQDFATYRFWKFFEEGNYEQAAKTMLQHIDVLKDLPNGGEAYKPFLHSIYAICQHLSNEFVSASEHFIWSAKEYYRLGFMRNSDVCYFHAIEAGKSIGDINKSFDIVRSIIDNCYFIAENYKSEIADILKSYYSDIYIGAAVLCRRVIELFLSQLLEEKFAGTVREQIDCAKRNLEIPRNMRTGLHAILELALVRDLITKEEHIIASYIKDFGNNIHDRGVIKNEVDAKYAVQACLHLLHRIR